MSRFATGLVGKSSRSNGHIAALSDFLDWLLHLPHLARMNAPDGVTRLNAALEGRYHIERELGEGGMANVYLADDVRHERKVALKVLKPELAAVVGAERFLAEIKTTANLQHPHILPLFDSGEADSFLFYVMPFVEGETLRGRIERQKQLPVDEAVQIAVAVAHALQHAHERGVIHRDIKPANILMQDGEPVIADFGIALAVGAAGGSRLTETGLSVGTPYYMSPEQATGDQVIGPASDTYALACVLYEMLVGEPPYLGNTAQAVLGKIIQGMPVSATAVRKSVPANVDAAIRKALEKLPSDRFTDAQDFSRALTDPSFRHGEVAGVGADSVAGRWKTLALAASVATVLLTAGLVWVMAGVPDPPPVTRHIIEPFGAEYSFDRPIGGLTALAPDGSSMVYAGPGSGAAEWQLWLKLRGSAEATPLPGTEEARVPVYSPDSREIAFVSNGELKKRPVADGPVITLARGVDLTMAAVSWADDGTILYERDEGNALMQVSSVGGDPREVVAYGDSLLAYSLAFPGSRAAFVELCRTPPANCFADQYLAVVDLETGATTPLRDDVTRIWWGPEGHVIYSRRDGTVLVAPFDLDARDFAGPGIPLFQDVRASTSNPEMAVGADGTVVYIEAGRQLALTERQIVWFDRQGRVEPVDAAMGHDQYRHVALSPQDDRLAVIIATNPQEAQLHVKELPDGPLTRLTTGPGLKQRPVWTPDGRSIAYVLSQADTSGQALVVPADGSSTDSEVLLARERTVWEVFFTPDARGLVFREGNAAVGDADVGFIDLETDRVESGVLASAFNERGVSLSPDGGWMAYVSDAAGGVEVFVRPFPAAGASRVQVSTNSGVSPVWAHNGRELFYVDSEGLWAATYTADETFAVEQRTLLFRAQLYAATTNWRWFDVTSDDQRFVGILQPGAVAVEEKYILIRNWFEEVKPQLGN